MHHSIKEPKIESTRDIFPTEALELISQNGKSDELIIIDVSTPYEYGGLHLEGALNVSLFSRHFKVRMNLMDKDKTYLVYCKLGGRSKMAQKLMVGLGFRKVYNMTGGTLLWEEAGLPFASGIAGSNKFSFCPFFISIVAFKKMKRAWRLVLSHIAPTRDVTASSGQEY